MIARAFARNALNKTHFSEEVSMTKNSSNPSFIATVFSSLLLVTVGCSPSRVEPAIFPNTHFNDVGEAGVQRDIDECNALATRYVKDAEIFNKVARDTLTGGVIGSAAGALGGVITGGNVGRSVGAGAAIGVIIPLLQSIFQSTDSTPSRTTFVEYCLRDRGYDIPR